MKKAALRITICITLLFMFSFLSSCKSGVSQEDYDKLKEELLKASTVITTLSSDNAIKAEKMAEAFMYVQFLDLLMYPSFQNAGIPSRFNFDDESSWSSELIYLADIMKDQKINELLPKISEGESSIEVLADYCMGHIEEILKQE